MSILKFEAPTPDEPEQEVEECEYSREGYRCKHRGLPDDVEPCKSCQFDTRKGQPNGEGESELHRKLRGLIEGLRKKPKS